MEISRKALTLLATLSLGPAPTGCEPSPDGADDRLREAMAATPRPGGHRPVNEREANAALAEVMRPTPPANDLSVDRVSAPHLTAEPTRWDLLDGSPLVRFRTGSSRLGALDLRRVSAAAREAVALPEGWALTVHGHADATGSPTRNDALSLARANAVAAALRARGVPRSRLRVVAHGSREPLVADTRRDRWQNRRVSITASPATSG